MAASACGASGDPPPINLAGTVTVDGAGRSGVVVDIADVVQTDRLTTTTGSSGYYGFAGLNQNVRWQVSLLSGLPADAVCTPTPPQTVNLPALDVDFDCVTQGGGSCGQAADSAEADLAGNVTVLVNGVAVTGTEPAAVQEGDTITVRVPVTAGARFVVVSYTDTGRSENIGGTGAATEGDETVELSFEARGAVPGVFPSGLFPLSVVVENADGTRNVVYDTTLPGCTEVESVVETNGVFGTPTPAEGCTANCLDAGNPT